MIDRFVSWLFSGRIRMGDLLRLVSEVRAALAEVVEMSREIKQNLLDSKQLLDEIKKDNEVVGIGVKHNPATDR